VRMLSMSHPTDLCGCNPSCHRPFRVWAATSHAQEIPSFAAHTRFNGSQEKELQDH
jgi:hypothetical protein